MSTHFPQKLALTAGAMALAACLPASATVYLDGVSPLLSSYAPGTFDLGTHLPNYIGSSNGSSADGTNLDGNRCLHLRHQRCSRPAGCPGAGRLQPAGLAVQRAQG